MSKTARSAAVRRKPLAAIAVCGFALLWCAPSGFGAQTPKASKAAPRAVTPAPSPTPTKKANLTALPPILQEVEAKYAQAKTIEAEFTQVNDVAALKTTKTSSGVLYVKHPNKFRWETLKPDMNILVSDGHKFWFYTPPFDEGEHGQLIERRSSEVQSRLANALLSGSFSVTRGMKLRQESPSKFSLKPRPGTAGTVVRAEIEIDPELKLIQKVTLEHKGGNRSEITLTKIKLGNPIGDDVFTFTPPPNTDRVE